MVANKNQSRSCVFAPIRGLRRLLVEQILEQFSERGRLSYPKSSLGRPAAYLDGQHTRDIETKHANAKRSKNASPPPRYQEWPVRRFAEWAAASSGNPSRAATRPPEDVVI